MTRTITAMRNLLMTRLLASRIALETESSSPLPVLKQRKQLLNQNDNSQHHPKRILQLSTSDTFDGGSDSYSMIFFIFMIIVFIVLVGCLIKKNRDRYRRLPPREVLLEQRRRQRALIRRQRLRQMGIDPDSIAVNVRNDGASSTRSNNRLSLTTEQLESRRKLLLRTFEMDQVQTKLEQSNLIQEQSMAATTASSTVAEEEEVDVERGNDYNHDDDDDGSAAEAQQRHPKRQTKKQKKKQKGSSETTVSAAAVSSMEVQLPNRIVPYQPNTVPNQCAICLESYEIGEYIVWSNNRQCQHAFHQDCILEYLVPLVFSPPTTPVIPSSQSPQGEDIPIENPCPCCRQSFCMINRQHHQEKERGARIRAKSRSGRGRRNSDPPGRRVAG